MVTLNASHLFGRSFEPLFEKRRRLLPGLNDSFDCIVWASEETSQRTSLMILSLLYFTKKGRFFASIFPGEHYHNEAIAFFAWNLPSKLHQSVLIVLR